MLLSERCRKKERTNFRTNFRSFVIAVINIRVPEMNSMIHSKASNVRDNGWEAAHK